MEYEQFAAFMNAMQLLANCSRGKENQRTLKARTVVVKTDGLSGTEQKVVTHLP